MPPAHVNRRRCCMQNEDYILDAVPANPSTMAKKTKTKLHGLSPRANYTDRANRRLSAKWLPTFAVVSVTDPSGRILDFLDRSRYFSIK
jgi:hypothetical protein